jgi:hypothetical protein
MRKTTIGAVAVLAALAAAGCSSSPSSEPSSAPLSPAASASPAAHQPATAAVLATDLRAEGLPVRRLIVYTAATDPNAELGRQGGYTSKVAWVDQ